jgi:hypothetical protein
MNRPFWTAEIEEAFLRNVAREDMPPSPVVSIFDDIPEPMDLRSMEDEP